MADVVDKATRHRMMSGIRGKDTKPEILIRTALHRRGFRFRLHAKKLPGSPDILLPKYHAAIFVHGCFWHGHQCPLFKWPKTDEQFWSAKIRSNMERDIRAEEQLRAANWRVLKVWECALKGPGRHSLDAVAEYISTWLKGQEASGEISGNA